MNNGCLPAPSRQETLDQFKKDVDAGRVSVEEVKHIRNQAKVALLKFAIGDIRRSSAQHILLITAECEGR